MVSPTIDRVIEASKFDLLRKERKQLSTEQPVLVYTTSCQAGCLAGKLQNTVVVDQQTAAESLRECDKRAEGERFNIYLVTDPMIMRGTDWRSPSVGIALVLDRGFESYRDLI